MILFGNALAAPFKYNRSGRLKINVKAAVLNCCVPVNIFVNIVYDIPAGPGNSSAVRSCMAQTIISTGRLKLKLTHIRNLHGAGAVRIKLVHSQ